MLMLNDHVDDAADDDDDALNVHNDAAGDDHHDDDDDADDADAAADHADNAGDDDDDDDDDDGDSFDSESEPAGKHIWKLPPTPAYTGCAQVTDSVVRHSRTSESRSTHTRDAQRGTQQTHPPRLT